MREEFITLCLLSKRITLALLLLFYICSDRVRSSANVPLQEV